MVLLGIPAEKRNKIKIKVPDPETFCHRLWIHIARDVWKRPYLFYHQVKSIEQQNHLYQFETIIRRKIRSVIRDTIPMELMVQQLSNSDILTEEDKDLDSSDGSEEEGSETSDDESEEEESEGEGEGSETSETKDKESDEVDEDHSLSEVSDAEDKNESEEEVGDDDKSSTVGSEVSETKESDEEGSETVDKYESDEDVGEDKDESLLDNGPKEVGIGSEVSETINKDDDKSEPTELETPKANEEEIPLIQDTPVTIYEEPKKKLIHIQELMKHKKKHKSKDRFF